MNTLLSLTGRNIKLFFKDKAMFFVSLITPAILLLLYSTFLGRVFKDSFLQSLPKGFTMDEKVIDGVVGGQLVASILSVSCVTVAFCSNFLMVQDKVRGAIKDIIITPVKSSVLGLSYYLASVVSTLIVCLSATALCFIYMAIAGWYMSVADVFLLLLDVILLVLFGTILSSIINHFLKSEGQLSAVGTIVSSTYGFICGAYMPISTFGEGLQKVLSFLPGTYGTSLVKEHTLGGVMKELTTNQHLPVEAVEGIKDSLDYNVYFFENNVSEGVKFAILAGTVVVLIGIYVLINTLHKRKDK